MNNQGIEQYSIEELKSIIAGMRDAAYDAANTAYRDHGDTGACGFAWVEFPGIKGNTKAGRMLKAAGIGQDYKRTFYIWNPSGLSVQSVYVLEQGAIAAAKYMQTIGIECRACSRLD